MRAFKFIILLVLLACSVNAQCQATQSKPLRLPSDHLEKITTKTEHRKDTLLNAPFKVIDSVKQFISVDSIPIMRALDSINHYTSNLSESFSKPLDIVKKRVEVPAVGFIKSIEMDKRNVSDKVLSRQQSIKKKSDSIQNRLSSNLSLEKIKEKTKINSFVDEQIDSSDKEILGLQSLEVTNISIPETAKSIKDIGFTVPDLNPDLPQIEIPSLSELDFKEKLPDLKISEGDQLDKVSDISQEAEKVSSKISELEKSADDIGKLIETAPEKLEKLPEQAEKKLEDVTEVKALKGEIDKATEQRVKYEAMMQRYRDKKLLQEEIQRKARSVANDQLALHPDKIAEAQKKLAQSKKAFSNVKGVKSVFKRRSNELLGKKFYQRLVPGLTWQIYNKEMVSIDLGLQTGYRISPKLTTGIGFVYRIGFSDQYESYIKGLNTYGGRVYTDLAIAKGLFAHGEFEFLSVDSLRSQKLESVSYNVMGSYFGLGKRFKISRNFRGNIQGLYRVEYNGELPSVNKVTVRFGVEYIFRKPIKKLVIPKIK